LEKIRYLPCPSCKVLMHRVNFAKCSNVIVDVCKAHGTWFDKDELRRIVEFIRAGGFERARTNEIAELERQRRETEAARAAAAHERASLYRSSPFEPRENALSLAAAAVLSSFFE
jgi:Zn-finger nucleic acid-binding protein